MTHRIVTWIFLLSASVAQALPNHDNHAQVLKPGEWQLGLWEVQAGLTNTVQLGTNWPLWLGKIPNAEAKWVFHQRKGFDASFGTGFYHFDLREYRPDAPEFVANVIPLKLWFSWHLETMMLTLGLQHTRITTRGDASSNDDDDNFSIDTLTGALNAQSGVILPSILWKRGDGFAWLFDFQFSAYQRADGRADSTFSINQGDRVTGSATIQGETQADFEAKGARNLTVSALWYWTNFHLKLGLTMGHFMIPYANIFPVDEGGHPTTQGYPRIDLYWRF